jgi:hypothetical protein
VKGGAVRIFANLFADKDSRTLGDYEKQAKDIVTKQYEEVQGFELTEKEMVNGEKAFSTVFVGRYKPDGPAAKQPLARRRDFFMRRKGHIIHWIEISPADADEGAVDAAFKKARSGIVWM